MRELRCRSWGVLWIGLAAASLVAGSAQALPDLIGEIVSVSTTQGSRVDPDDVAEGCASAAQTGTEVTLLYGDGPEPPAALLLSCTATM